jgi:murein DD-endopeptidase MepM/ murein hydrolase activator NlpD
MILDDEGKTYKSNGLLCTDYYCYNKPVVAPADGIVEEIIDNIDDNEIGKIDTANNWGNSIIIRHLTGLYTQISHLKKGSFKVAKGDFVKRGDLLAHCGNSGRSPEPHLHFQVQATLLLGARTIDYPFAYYYEKMDNSSELHQFYRPIEGAKVCGTETNPLLKKVFDILPNTILKFSFKNEKGTEKTEQWEAYTDAGNNKYLYCKGTESSAFYVNDGTMFYFTVFYGNKKSLLYFFYLSAYKVFLGNSADTELKDAMPLNTVKNLKASIWLHDFIAPFYNYIRVFYSIKPCSGESPFDPEVIQLKSKIEVSVFKNLTTESRSVITLAEKGINGFTYETEKIKIEAKCVI